MEAGMENGIAKEPENRYRVLKVYTACMLLKEISESDDPMNVAEVCRALDIPPDVAYRYLKTLEECRFVAQVEGGYRLGDAVALCWRSYRLAQKKTIERAKQALKETAITGEEAEDGKDE